MKKFRYFLQLRVVKTTTTKKNLNSSLPIKSTKKKTKQKNNTLDETKICQKIFNSTVGPFFGPQQEWKEEGDRCWPVQGGKS